MTGCVGINELAGIPKNVLYAADMHATSVSWMMSRTSQYAIQALVYLAGQPAGTCVSVRDIASQLNVPPAYLAKIMQSLHKGMFLSARRGPRGGVYLRADVDTTGLLDILAHTERSSLAQECLLGLKTCSDVTACPMHGAWQPVKQAIVDLLQECTLRRLAEENYPDNHVIPTSNTCL